MQKKKQECTAVAREFGKDRGIRAFMITQVRLKLTSAFPDKVFGFYELSNSTILYIPEFVSYFTLFTLHVHGLLIVTFEQFRHPLFHFSPVFIDIINLINNTNGKRKPTLVRKTSVVKPKELK